MKKWFAVILCFALVLPMTACGKQREKNYAEEPEELVIERGTWKDGIYTSDFAELTFLLPEGWQIIDEATLEETYTNDVTICDMACQKNDEGTSQVIVTYEDLLKTKGTYAVTEEEYLEEAAALYTNYGFTVTNSEDVELSGNTYRKLGLYAGSEGEELRIYFVVRKIGHYMLGVNFVFENDEQYAAIVASLA